MMRISDLFHKTGSISPDDAKQMLSERGDDIILLDVREPREYEQVHIPGAVLMPMSVLPDRMRELDHSRTVIAY